MGGLGRAAAWPLARIDVVHLQAFWDPQKAAKHYAVVKADVEAGHPIGAV